MRWQSGRRSDNIEDRRGMRIGGGAIGGGAVLIGVVMALLGAPEGAIRAVLQQGGSSSTTTQEVDPAQQPLVDFMSVVLADTEDTWNELFQARGQRYEAPTLVLYTD